MNERKILVVTESTEWKNCTKYFPNYPFKGIACSGHLLRLKLEGGVDFKTMGPVYEWIPKDKSGKFKDFPSKKEIVKKINDLGKWADQIFFASDPDSEGRAISMELLTLVDKSLLPKVIVRQMSDWSKESIEKNIINNNKPDKIKYPYHNELPFMDKKWEKYGLDCWTVVAQQLRAVTDMVIGFALSNFIRNKTQGQAVSIGRIQTLVPLLLYQRAQEQKNFVSKSSLGLQFNIHTDNPSQDLLIDLVKLNPNFKPQDGELYKEDSNKPSQIIKFNNIKDLKNYVKNYCAENKFKLEAITKKESIINPGLPWDTLSLNKYISSHFGYKVKDINDMLAYLYTELAKVTYPRTDSCKLDPEYVEKSLKYLKTTDIDKNDLNILNDINKYYFMKTSKNSQEGHQALTPVKLENTPEKVKKEIFDNPGKWDPEKLFNIYKVVYERTKLAFFKASENDNYSLLFDNNSSKFAGKFTNLKYAGWKKYSSEYEDEDGETEKELSPAPYKKDNVYKSSNWGTDTSYKQYKTLPPPSYTWSSIIAKMKKNGWGRPSFLGSMADLLGPKKRNYVVGGDGKVKMKLTPAGELVAKNTLDYLFSLLNYDLTAEVYKAMDDLSEGKNVYIETMNKFLKKLNDCLTKNGMKEWTGENQKSEKKPVELTNLTCPKCGKPLKKVEGKYGVFFSCSGYPKCNYSQKSDKQVETHKCPKCGKVMVDFEWTDKKTGKKRVSRKCLNQKCKYVEWDPK